MNGNTESLNGLVASVLSAFDIALYIVAPTYSTNGTFPSDTDYDHGDFNAVAGGFGVGDVAETYEVSNTGGAIVFGTAGAATGYTIAAIGLIDSGGDCQKWVPYSKVIAVGEIPRISINELTVIVS